MMYLNLVKRWFGELWYGLFPRGLRRSSALPILIIAIVIVAPIVAWRLHRMGRFGALKREIKGEVPTAPAGPRPGGLDPIVLTRNQTAGSNLPEFRSATILPGLGMQVLQLTAYLPERGEVSLLAAPTAKQIADGTTPVRTGVNDRWGAIEVPWGGVLYGTMTPLGTTIRTEWRGRAIEAPTTSAGHAISEGGLLNTLGADASQVDAEHDPGVATGVFKSTTFDEHWASRTEVTVKVVMGARSVDLDVTAKNVGDTPEPMGIGWHPRFVVPSGERDSAELRLPNGDLLEIADRSRGIPSGRMVAPPAALMRFQNHPAPLGVESLDEAIVHMKAGLLDSGASAEFRDPASEIGLRLIAESDNMRELRISSPAGSNYVSMGMQTNLDDPLGREWGAGDNAAILTLMPGQTAEWKVRLEIFSISGRGKSVR